MYKFEIESRHLSLVLDHLGYSQQLIKFRQNGYKEWNSLSQKNLEDFNCFIVGSKAEGLTNSFESDVDVLYVDKDVLCLEKDLRPLHMPANTTFFVMETDKCSPGYSELKLAKKGELLNELAAEALCPNIEGPDIFSASRFAKAVDNFYKQNPLPKQEQHDLQGPSSPVTRGFFQMDRVQAFHCICPKILGEWAKRPRKHNWPSPELIREVEGLDAFLVATGSKMGDRKDVEWRLCFNRGEVRLMESLNTTQLKLYVLLKMVVKDILRPPGKEVTSYAVKNIVWWMAEMHPQEEFTEVSLCYWLIHGLKMLRESVKMQSLPYYMITSRNILSGRMDKDYKQILVNKLSRLIKIGPRFLLKCTKLRVAFKTPISQLRRLRDWRDELEMLRILIDNRRLELQQQLVGLDSDQVLDLIEEDAEFQVLSQRRADLALPSWRRLKREGLNIERMIEHNIGFILC